MAKLKKALDIRELRKAKYLKRTGTSGNYKYTYKEGNRKVGKVVTPQERAAQLKAAGKGPGSDYHFSKLQIMLDTAVPKQLAWHSPEFKRANTAAAAVVGLTPQDNFDLYFANLLFASDRGDTPQKMHTTYVKGNMKYVQAKNADASYTITKQHIATAYAFGKQAAHKQTGRGDGIDIPTHDDAFDDYVEALHDFFPEDPTAENPQYTPQWGRARDTLYAAWKKGRLVEGEKIIAEKAAQREKEIADRALISQELDQKREAMKKEIGATYFEVEEDTGNQLSLASRKHGSVAGETHGTEDLAEAQKISSKLARRFGSEIKVSVDVVDEWVIVDARIEPKEDL